MVEAQQRSIFYQRGSIFPIYCAKHLLQFAFFQCTQYTIELCQLNGFDDKLWKKYNLQRILFKNWNSVDQWSSFSTSSLSKHWIKEWAKLPHVLCTYIQVTEQKIETNENWLFLGTDVGILNHTHPSRPAARRASSLCACDCACSRPPRKMENDNIELYTIQYDG